MNNTYPKSEKLKSRSTIDLLFTNGKSAAKYPLRLVYVPMANETEMIKMGVSVSKKYFKKAVDRNYYKRLLRECYRHNKQLLIENLREPHAFMLLYQSKDRLPYSELSALTADLFRKFALQNKGTQATHTS